LSEVHDALASLSDEERKYVLVRHYPLFGAYYFGLKMADFMGDMVSFSDTHQRACILIPAGHTKSSTFGNYNIIRHMCWNPNIRIQLIMSVFEDAEEYCKAIQNEITSNELLMNDFGQFYNSRDWTGSKFTIAQRQHNDPHATLTVYGAGGKSMNWSLKGKGCDYAVMDDVVTEDTANSPETRKRQRSWARMTVFKNPRPMWPIHPRYGLMVPKGMVWPADAPYNPRPGAKIPYGKIDAPGTRFDPHDLYQDLMDDPLWDTLTLDCWTDENESKPLWPDYWTNEALQAERESGLLYFNKRMRNRPQDESEIVFHREWFMGDEDHPGCLNRGRSFGELPIDDDGSLLDLFKPLGFDPASGEATKYAAWPTYDLLGFPRKGDTELDMRYVIDLFRAQVGVEVLLDIMLEPDEESIEYKRALHPGFYAKYHFDVCKVERNGFANLMTSHARVTKAKRRGVLIEPHTTGRNKLDPITGVKSMAQIFRDGLVDIPYKTEADKKIAKEFIDQFVYFSFDRNGRKKSLTDYVMAFWFAELAIRATGTTNKAYRHPSSPYTIANPYYVTRKSQYTATKVSR